MENKKNKEKKKMFTGFCKKYPDISPLIIFKTLEYARSYGMAFDALEDYNNDLPIVWDENTQKWSPEVLREYEFLHYKD